MSLTPNELIDNDRSDATDQSIARVFEMFVSQVLPRELKDKGQEKTPPYDLYEDEKQNEQTFSQLAEELKPMPEVG